jgi:hypothetical protein
MANGQARARFCGKKNPAQWVRGPRAGPGYGGLWIGVRKLCIRGSNLAAIKPKAEMAPMESERQEKIPTGKHFEPGSSEQADGGGTAGSIMTVEPRSWETDKSLDNGSQTP